MEDVDELRRLLREEQRRREEAEELAQASLPQTLQQYLEACHSLNLAIQVVTDPTLTTQGNTTNPTGRIFPRRIIPWDGFASRQEEIWNDLSTGDIFFSQPAFPSQHQLDYVKSFLKPISSEIGLRDFERDVVENAVQRLVDRTYMDPLLRSSLGLQGTITFESHTNLGTTEDMETPAAPKAHRKARGKGNRADQFCIYRTSNGQNIPALAIEYKAPHKLTVDEVVTGLESEIWPERDVINQDGQGFAFEARVLATAVITQLFSYMIGKGIQYGYVCTGEVFVFLRILDDPANVYYSVCVPNLDVMDDDETRLHRTAAAQVFAFILQALRTGPPPELWHDEAEKLGTWAVEYDDVWRNMPVTEGEGKETPEPRASPYKPQRWKGFKRSRIMTRYGCKQPDADVRRPEEDDEDPPSPTPNKTHTAGNVAPSTGKGSTGGRKRGRRGGRHGGRRRGKQQEQGQSTKLSIESRPYCTQQCLLGLAYGGPTDEHCPNSAYHGQGHINRLEFLRLIREQLATDRGRDADCVPLYISGARGSLFKVRLSTHGYTLVAKGMEGLDRAHLQHENEVYDRLRTIQGKYVPVCLGSIDLVLPYYYDSGVYVHFMFLSWAGRPLFACGDLANTAHIAGLVSTIFDAVHKLGVLHRDAEPRNILYDTNRGSLMLIDFERAELSGRQPLGSIGPNGQTLKRKRGISHNQGKDEYAKELESAVGKVLRCLRAH